MTTKDEYYAKLRDPRWQQKRLQIFERDKWTCQICGSTTRTLNVHHIAYHPEGREPWDGDDALLVTACDICHELEHQHYRVMLYQVQSMLAEMGIRTSIDLYRIIEKVAPVCTELAAKHTAPVAQFLPLALGMYIQEWPEERAKMLADGYYYANRG